MLPRMSQRFNKIRGKISRLLCWGGGGGMFRADPIPPYAFMNASVSFLPSFCHCLGKTTIRTIGRATETEGRRGTTQHGALSSFVSCRASRTACHDVLYRLPWQGSAQLRASGNSSSWYITKCTRNTDFTGIMHSWQGPVFYCLFLSHIGVANESSNRRTVLCEKRKPRTAKPSSSRSEKTMNA
jgi:hypothetical protein